MNDYMLTPPILQIVGYSNSGKTTLLTELIKRLESADIRVGVIKHNGGDDLKLDQPGKDSYRLAEAGASLVAVQSKSLTAFLERKPIPLAQLVKRMNDAGAQYILVEGFKREHYEKIVVIREEADKELLAQLSGAVAVASWIPIDHCALPVFEIDDYTSLTRFLLTKLHNE